MKKGDAIAELIAAKRTARETMEAQRKKAKTPRERSLWKRWIENNTKEIEALEAAQIQLAGIKAVKAAARAHI